MMCFQAGRFASTPRAALVGVLLLAGCADSVSYTHLADPPRPLQPKPAQEVEVLNISPPSRPHRNIGVLQAVSGRLLSFDPPRLIGKLRDQAARLGCDALLITSVDRRETRYDGPSIEGSCLVYDEVQGPSARPTPATAR